MGKNTAVKWAVLMGINGYHESQGRLKYLVNDCRRLADVIPKGDDASSVDHVVFLADDGPIELETGLRAMFFKESNSAMALVPT